MTFFDRQNVNAHSHKAKRDDGDHSGRTSPAPPSGRDRKGNKYEPPSQSRVPVAVDEGPVPDWDDSDAEQQTLRELRTTLQKEKTRENESKAAQKALPDDGDHSSMAGRNPPILEKWMQGRDEKKRQKNGQEENQQDVAISQGRKTGVTALPSFWSDRGNRNDVNVTPRGDSPYQPLVIKDPDGNRFLYVFSEGSNEFYEVEEEDTDAVMPKTAERVEKLMKRGLQEFYGALRIVTSFIVLLVLETLSFVVGHIARPLVMGVIATAGNQLVKPVLAGAFNFIVQPFTIFAWNVLSGLRHVCQPVIDILDAVMSKCAILLRSFRLVEVNLGDEYFQSRKGVVFGRGGRYSSEVV
ncbi:uncharacterized protein [Littorina saxatilis]|uniref:uncharacterized protein isoform X2 n=1 Tax=Littorina saxatilis TaxID=31220 RepID=UPI0038B51E11